MVKDKSGIRRIYPLSNLKRSALLLASVFFIFSAYTPVFCQEATSETNKDPAQGVNAHDIQKAFEKAMKDIEKERGEKEKARVDLVKASFKEEVERWLSAAKAKEAAGLNNLVDQQWEQLQEFGPYVHYDYYLRDFEFIVRTNDIIKTDTLLSPYRGYMDLVEKRYAERYHTPDISYINNFLFTVTTPMKVNFEYRDDKFVMINTEVGKETIENAWPRSVKEKFKLKP